MPSGRLFHFPNCSFFLTAAATGAPATRRTEDGDSRPDYNFSHLITAADDEDRDTSPPRKTKTGTRRRTVTMKHFLGTPGQNPEFSHLYEDIGAVDSRGRKVMGRLFLHFMSEVPLKNLDLE